jgi:undecaprenyl-diphosphatase
MAFALVAATALVVVYREQDKPFGFEAEWMEEIVEHRSEFWTVPALVFNTLGGGLVAGIALPILIVGLLLLFRRPWAALYFAIAEVVNALVVLGLKQLIGRPRPTDMLVSPDFGSFPSGHSANAAVLATVLGIIFTRTWVWAAGVAYTIAMMLSRTYLGAHWISDTTGGALLGAGIAVVVWAPFAYDLYREKRETHQPIWKAAAPARTS